MFPEITQDEVFRLETRRLWLRWQAASDVPALQALMAVREVAEMTSSWPHPLPEGEAARRRLQANALNASGAGLVFAVVTKFDGAVVGSMAVTAREGSSPVVGYAIAPGAWGRGFATEALQAAIDATFTLTREEAIEASVRVHNVASRRVLEKCGFAFVGSALSAMPARGGRFACDTFCLSRKTWESLKGWRAPIFARSAVARDVACSGAAC